MEPAAPADLRMTIDIYNNDVMNRGWMVCCYDDYDGFIIMCVYLD